MKSCCILVVEDKANVDADIDARLAAMGYRLAGRVTTGNEALARIEERHPDLVLMDIRLQGGMDGIATAEEVRRRFGIPVIFLTAYPEEAALDRVKLAEPFGYILKPFDDRELKSAIEIALYKHAAEEKMTEELRHQAFFLQTVIDAIPYPVFYKNVELRYLGCNKAHEELIGFTRDKFIGKTVYDIWPDNLAERYDHHDRELLTTGQSCAYESEIQDANGARRDLLYFKDIFRNADETIGGIIGVCLDITERKKAEEALRKSEASYRRLFEDATEGIVLADAETGEIMDCNRAILRMTGFNRSDLIGMPQTVLHPSEKGNPAISSTFAAHRSERGGDVLSAALATKSGALKQVEIKANVLEMGDRRVMQGFFRDVTADFRYHREREATLQLLRLLNDHNDLHEMIRGLTGLLKEWSGCEAVGVRLQEGDDFPYFETRGFPAEFVEAERYLCQQDIEGRVVRNEVGSAELECMCGNIIRGRFDSSLPFFTREGSFWSNNTTGLLATTTEKDRRTHTRNRCNREGYESVALIPLRHGDNVMGLLQLNDRSVGRFTPELISFLEGVAQQIAIGVAQRRAQIALAENEKRFRQISEASGECIFEIDPEGCITFLSDRIYDILGYKPDEHVGKNFLDVVLPSERESVWSFFVEQVGARSGFRDFEYAALAKSGRTAWLSVTAVPKFAVDNAFLGYYGAASDITERRQTEEALRKSEEQYRRILGTTREGISIADENFRVTLANKRLAEMLGCEPDEIVGRTLDRFTFEEDMPILFERRNERIQGISHQFERRFRRKDGSTGWAYASMTPIIDEDGRFKGSFAMLTDITSRKQAEEEKVHLESQLRQSQKMEAIGTLAGGVAHDFNNILTAIIGFSSIMKMDLNDDDPKKAYIDQILGASERAANLTQSLLVFSRKQQVDLKSQNMNEIIKGTTKLLKRLLTEDIELKTDLTSADGTIMADITQIDQILINLAANARDAMPKGGRLKIETSTVRLGDNFLRMHGGGEAGDYVRLSVSDTGIGMDERTQEHIFEPFFTTKEVGKGTGLGLSTVYGIVKQHNGYITVSSKPGQGSIFHIYFPLIKAVKVQEPTDSEEMRGGAETILIAEDDPAVRRLEKSILERYGYTTMEAGNGEEAARLFEENRERIDLIVMDVVMPKRNGKEVYDQVRRINPEIKVLFASGYTGDVVLDKGVEDTVVDFIKKPILPAEFLKKVREVLDR